MFRFGGGFLYCGLFFWDCIVSESVVCRFGLGAVGEIRVKIVYVVNGILFTIVLRKRLYEAHTPWLIS